MRMPSFWSALLYPLSVGRFRRHRCCLPGDLKEDDMVWVADRWSDTELRRGTVTSADQNARATAGQVSRFSAEVFGVLVRLPAFVAKLS
jgi:hypothetical protein